MLDSSKEKRCAERWGQRTYGSNDLLHKAIYYHFFWGFDKLWNWVQLKSNLGPNEDQVWALLKKF